MISEIQWLKDQNGLFFNKFNKFSQFQELGIFYHAIFLPINSWQHCHVVVLLLAFSYLFLDIYGIDC